MQQSTAAFFSSSNTFYASITQSGDIVASDMMGNRIVGVSIERYKQLEQMATEATATAERLSYGRAGEHGKKVAAAKGEDAGRKLHDTRGQIDHC